MTAQGAQDARSHTSKTASGRTRASFETHSCFSSRVSERLVLKLNTSLTEAQGILLEVIIRVFNSQRLAQFNNYAGIYFVCAQCQL